MDEHFEQINADSRCTLAGGAQPLRCRPPTQLFVNEMNVEANFGFSIRMKLLYVIGGVLTQISIKVKKCRKFFLWV